MRFRGADVVTGGRSRGEQDVLVVGDRIAEVGHVRSTTGPVIDATGLVLAPGLIDIHIHGAMGHDTLDATSSALGAIGRHLASNGVTSWAPTTASHVRGAIDEVLVAHGAHRRGPDEARSIGVHLEGPYLSEARCGAQDPAHLRDADEDEWSSWFATGQIAQITVAPERDPDGHLIRTASAAGVRVAIGHSDASYERTLQAVDDGVTQATHLFNGMPPLHHRDPGVVGACLVDPRVEVQLIADLVHTHPGILRLVHAAVGADRVLLISDAMRATGLGDGEYLLAEQQVTVTDGVARTAVGGLAGSTLELLTGVGNYRDATGCELAVALHAASGVPGRALGLDDRGLIEPGYAADLLLLDPEELRPVLTVVGGTVAHEQLPDDRWIKR
jgi:N-acetylglucosamine-6-phosphate deacetylase